MKLNSTQGRITFLLKIIVALSAIIGTLISAFAGHHSFMGGAKVFMYFTIQSNIAIAIICLLGMIFIKKGKTVSVPWQIIKFVGTVSITLTGVVFCFVLAPTMGSFAWNIQNLLTHVIVPVASIIDFFVVSNLINLKKSSIVYIIIPPILYAIYAGIAYVNGWVFSGGYNYPYFFLNWGSKAGAFGFTNELPFMGTAWWILALLIFLLLVGYGYLKIVDSIKNRFYNA